MPGRIEDYGLIGGRETVALVGRDGSIDWLCWPRSDSDACFAALLGGPEHGRWLVAPADPRSRSRRRYRDGSLVLETEFEAPGGGVAVLTDCMPPRGTASDLVRLVTGKRGRVAFRMELALRFGYGANEPWVTPLPDGAGLRATAGPDLAVLRTPVPLAVEDRRATAAFEVGPGDEVPFVLTYGPSHLPDPQAVEAAPAVAEADAFWRGWSAKCRPAGEWTEAVCRSAITLKAMTYRPTGGIVAAATASLPEAIGGPHLLGARRDADAAGPAARRLPRGGGGVARLAAARGHGQPVPGPGDVRAVGRTAPARVGAGLAAGLRRLPPRARRQRGAPAAPDRRLRRAAGRAAPGAPERHRLLGGRLGAAAGARPPRGGGLGRARPRHLGGARRAGALHALQGHGLGRGGPRRARRGGVRPRGPVARWRDLRRRIHEDVCRNGYDPAIGGFVRAYGSRELDASLLPLPVVGFLPAADPRVRGTVAAVERELVVDGLVRRYRTGGTSDGLPSREGAFLACSFWLADAYAMDGQTAEARRLFERLLSLRNDLGLLTEEYDPAARRMLGNFPQAFSHVSLVNTAYTLDEAGGAPARPPNRTPRRSGKVELRTATATVGATRQASPPSAPARRRLPRLPGRRRAMKRLVAPAVLAGGLLFGGSAMLVPGSAAAQARLDPRTGEWERLGRAEFERGHRAGREDKRDHFARHGFDDPWFGYGYGCGPRNTGPFDLGLGRPGHGDFFGSD